MVLNVCPLGQHISITQYRDANSQPCQDSESKTLTGPGSLCDFACLRTSSVDDSIQEVVSQHESWREMQAEEMALKWLPSLEWPGRGQVQ